MQVYNIIFIMACFLLDTISSLIDPCNTLFNDSTRIHQETYAGKNATIQFETFI
jgi:hypothetical protein